MERRIPRTMSSQHPDNASAPPWNQSPLIAGDDEVEEIYQSWFNLGCQEAMWDAEGKDVDLNVIRKLLTKHGEVFREKLIGRDYFLTYRIPNPAVEKSDRKVFFETLQSIPKHFDVCKVFYGDGAIPPVFEVILPFTSSVHQMIQVVNTYRKAVVQLEDVFIDFPNVKLKDIIGEVIPDSIEVIPLFEDFESMANADKIVSRYIELTSPRYVRVFIARSDPALNNGLLAATVMAKLLIAKLVKVQNSTGIEIFPIIGVGTLPFRGGLNPTNVDRFLDEYGYVATATVQSAFRYDYPQNLVVEAVNKLNNNLPSKSMQTDAIDETTALKVVEKLSKHYRMFAEAAAPTIAHLSRLVPPRRTRKLHIGAFSYGRRLGNIELPRAIPYACVMYSLGLPPEFIGLKALHELSETEYSLLRDVYVNMRDDLTKVSSMVSFENINILLSSEVENRPDIAPIRNALPLYVEDLETAENMLDVKVGPRTFSERKYLNLVNNFLLSYLENDTASAAEELLKAARARRCLG
ncbi:MAG: phosphoenolpyruvate carboxylase [Candidatus Caldarchaeum sp.]|nr:phosphoenolpyruvate carboxylase [Candidatus Caldarchaeum sp.]